jgi:glycosyltransferase A (GT-A) superfamily protein (DUF2064 family)
MTTIAVLADPPRPGAVLPALAGGPLDPEEAADLYEALLRDACLAIDGSGADLLVNYRAPDDEERARDAVEDSLTPVMEAPASVRYEVQVGSDRSARVGNTITHLLQDEGVQSAALLDPTAALVERRYLDSAAMKLRDADVVVGPAAGGRLWYAGFTEAIDFSDALAAPALGTLTKRARTGGASVDFLETRPLVATPADLASLLVTVRARERAEKPVPEHTSGVLATLDIGVDAVAPSGLALDRDGTDRS